MAKKNASPPLKMRKVPVLDEEEVDNTFIKSLKSSPMRTVVPSKVKITYPADISSNEEEEESEDESNSLSPELGSVATKPSTKAITTLISKGTIQTKSVPDPIERQKANVATKGKQPIVATKFEETKYDDSEDSDESNEEFDAEEEPEEEDEEVSAKTTSKPSATAKDKGKGIESSDTQWYVATKAFSQLFFTK